jgi:hypothetical protein
MRPRYLAPLATALLFFNTIIGVNAMDQVKQAVDRLVGSQTAAEEKQAAERLMELARAQRIPLNLAVFDSATGRAVPINTLGTDPGRPVYVELAVGSGPAQRWQPKHLQNVFIVLRE